QTHRGGPLTDPLAAAHPVAPLPTVLGALQDPVRLEMVRRLSNAGAALRCANLYDGINKSTATHHFKIPHEARVTERLATDGHTYQRLRREAAHAAVPGAPAPVL